MGFFSHTKLAGWCKAFLVSSLLLSSTIASAATLCQGQAYVTFNNQILMEKTVEWRNVSLGECSANLHETARNICSDFGSAEGAEVTSGFNDFDGHAESRGTKSCLSILLEQ